MHIFFPASITILKVFEGNIPISFFPGFGPGIGGITLHKYMDKMV